MIIGIDLGTTNSLASVWRDGEATLVPNSLGEVLTPSVVSLDRNGDILVGAAARERMVSHPQHSAAVFKRMMGTGRTSTLGDRSFRAEELSSLVLRALKADAEAFLGMPVEEAVITVPAYFNDAQRKATKIAGELAGLRVERVLNEPTAAALAYGLHEQQAGRDGKILVFDLGGGTFDVSVIDLFDGVMEVRATAGDNFLGGEDFDSAIMDWFRETARIDIPLQDDASSSGSSAHMRLRRAAEQARRALGVEDQAVMEFEIDGRTAKAVLDAATFLRISEPLLDRLRKPVARALADSRIRREDLSHIVLAGGATRMPAVRKLAATLFGRFPLQTIDPDRVVALGAAVQAGLKTRDKALSDVVLTDVAPYTLGIEVVESFGGGSASGRLLPIIERNTVVPVSRVQTVTPVHDFQPQVNVRIYQGESRLVKDNIPLGKLMLELQPRRREEQTIEVRFTYDINGLLEVSARSMIDGVAERIIIEQHAGVLSADEIKEKMAALAHLKLPAREAARNRLLLARAERAYEESLGSHREELARCIAHFEAALANEEQQAAAMSGAELEAMIDRIEAAQKR
ncbi:molecular chaperone HscC [Rhizobium sp. P38BS-XIX]|uniref:Hsp70 family protein n=1 Tax=Rhizobium sp. P38BS-XIX TaxID=2726740 RepID=UPI001456F7A5|nr:molecular chaperone HscC [Rhizobium sp. P38BS-XIX]NLS01616.1 molecular chaperone HscC [Rhizobium sp. P38BS-XIX]